MSTVLHIASSPRRQRSASLEIAQAFISHYCQRYPATEVKTLDLWRMDLPEFDEDAMAAKYAGLSDTPLTETQKSAWDGLRSLADHLHEADILIFSIPLWNFGIPYKLKHFIDLVSQKDILFSFDAEEGFGGLLNNKKAVVVYARGLDYTAGSFTPAQEFDFQKPYFESWLKFVGVTDVSSVVVEKTLFGSDIDTESRRRADREAQQIAAQLAPPCSKQHTSSAI
ncbi:FMN-dependent NADH-azoreductase [Litchfieldella rifensis]|uniref:FMN dependent NADH:quinone oxidoreductase n=1 Tax=Litchfieldella rifensis TaxID=762643 RepID=A0ABV7LJ45_9GAMM